jgi:hypothetical protein
MPNERETTVVLGDSLDKRIDKALSLLSESNPHVKWSREQIIRLVVGYGLNHLFGELEKIS